MYSLITQIFYQTIVFRIERHVYKYSSDVWKYVISTTLKICKVKEVSMRVDVKL